jgi:CysZ protein
MIEGFCAAAGGILFVLITPRIWLHAAVPALLLLFLACGLAGAALYGVDWLTGAMVGQPETVWGHIGAWLLEIVLALLALLTATMFALALAQPLSGFALEAVALAQERRLLGDNPPHSTFLAALWVSTRASVVMLVVGGIVYTILFVIGVAFPAALVVTGPLGFLTTAWLLAWNFLDYPLSLRGLGVIARLRWAVRHFDEFTVFGAVWAFLLIVPGLFFVILPMGVAGATRLVVYGELEEQFDAAQGPSLTLPARMP